MALLLAVLALAGCGSSGESEKSGLARKASGYVAWPFFGRVPERTHYLPAERAGARPAAEAGLVDQHPRADRVPAGDRRRRRLHDQQVRQRQSDPPQRPQGPLGTELRPEEPRQADRRHRAGLLPGARLRRLPRRLLSSPATPRPARGSGRDNCTPTSNPRRCRSTATSTSAPTPPRSSPSTPSDGQTVWTFNSPGAIKASPSYDAGHIFVADYQSSMFALNADDRQAGLAHQHQQGGAVRQGRLLLLARDRLRPRLRRPRRRHRLRLRREDRQGRVGLPDRRRRSTARPPSPRSPAPRRPSTSAPKTAASTPSTRAPARSAGPTTSAARCRARRP